MYVSAIVVAAGRGSRFRSPVSKALVEIGHKPVIAYSLAVLNNHPHVKDIVVVANKQNQLEIARKIKFLRLNKVKRIVLGGAKRQFSVSNGLKALDARADLVLIHDAARPFITQKLVSAAIKQAAATGAAVVGVPVVATIKEARVKGPGLRVKKTVARERLWEIQTPQVFKKDLILKAHKKFGKIPVTDDAMLVEKQGKRVALVLGSYDNIKITTPQDLIIAEAILKWHSKSA